MTDEIKPVAYASEALLARLSEGHSGAYNGQLANLHFSRFRIALCRHDEAVAEIELLRREVGALQWALEPFAEFATKVERFVEGRALCGGDPKMETNDFTLGNFIRARDVLIAFTQRRSNPVGSHDEADMADNRPRYSTQRLRLELRHARDLALEEAAELHEREAAKYGGGKRWAKKIAWHQAMAEMIRALKGGRA